MEYVEPNAKVEKPVLVVLVSAQQVKETVVVFASTPTLIAITVEVVKNHVHQVKFVQQALVRHLVRQPLQRSALVVVSIPQPMTTTVVVVEPYAEVVNLASAVFVSALQVKLPATVLARTLTLIEPIVANVEQPAKMESCVPLGNANSAVQ